MPPATFDVQESPGISRLVVRGDVDMAAEEPFLAFAAEALGSGPATIVVDLNQVDFMDSSGLRALLQCRRRADACGCQMKLAVGPGPVSRLLTMAGVTDRFDYE